MSRPPAPLLIVDDDPFTASLLEFMFQREQYDVTLLQDGQAALAYIEHRDPVPVVLLEIMLPHVNGFDLLRAIRQHPAWRDTKVVMLSAKDQIVDIKKAFELGADDYVVKPFDPEELLARVRRFNSGASR